MPHRPVTLTRVRYTTGEDSWRRQLLDMDWKTRTTRGAVSTTALIIAAAGLSACSNASGSAGGGEGVYIGQDNSRYVLVIDGETVSSARTVGTTDDRCRRHEILHEDAKNHALDPDNVHPGDPYGEQSYTDVYIGTMNEERTTVLWAPESEDDGEVVNVQIGVPLEDLVTLDGEIYVPIDSEQGEALADEERSRVCD